MKILLCVPSGKRDKTNLIWTNEAVFPLGVCYVASALERDGHSVTVCDLRIGADSIDRYRKLLCITHFDVVGFSVVEMLCDATIHLAALAKASLPQCRLVVGGPFVTTHPKLLLELSHLIDFAVIGEGEITTVELLRSLVTRQVTDGVLGIVYRNGQEIIQTPNRPLIPNLDSIPWPARHLLNHDYCNALPGMFFRLPQLPMLTSRGCPYDCTFCDNRLLWGGSFRRRSPSDVIKELQYLVERYGAREIMFVDDTFTVPRHWIDELTELLATEGMDVVWRCSTRVDAVTPEMLRRLYTAGCRSIGYGIESGNDTILKAMKKRTTVEQVKRAIAWTKDAGIETRGYFMLNFPGETKASIEETIALSRDLELDYAGFKITNPLHGEGLRALAESSGRIIADACDDHDASMGNTVFFVQEGLSAEEVKSSYRRAIRGFYLRPSYVYKTIRRLRNYDVFVSHLRGLVRLLWVR